MSEEYEDEFISLADVQANGGKYSNSGGKGKNVYDSGTGFNTGYSGTYPGTFSGNRGKQDSGASGFTGVVRPPKKSELNFEVGVPYYLPWSTPYKDSWEVFKVDNVTIPQLEVMRREDPQIRALINLICQPIIAALRTSSVVPIKHVDGGTEEAAFIDMMLNTPENSGGMVIPFTRIVSQMLLAVVHGFAAFEMVYWVPDVGPLAGKITLRKLSYRPPDTLVFLTDNSGEFDGWRQRTFFRGHTVDVKIPGVNGVYYACNEAENIFYGVSMFESAFKSYDSKAKLLYLTNIAAQRGAVGTRVGTMPPNPAAEDKNNFVRAMAQLGLVPYIILPTDDWTVQSLNETTQFDFLSLINYHNNQMSKSVLAQWFDDNSGGGANDNTLVDFSRNDDSIFIMMLQTIMDEIAVVINQKIIPRFIDWNFGSGKYPTFKWGAFTDEQKAAISTTFNVIAAAGQNSNVSPDFMHALEQRMAEEIGLPIDYDTVNAKWQQQQALDDELQALQTEQQMELIRNPPAPPPAQGQPQAPTKSASKSNSGNPNPNPPPVQVSPKVKPKSEK